jgi:hypothetical protein
LVATGSKKALLITEELFNSLRCVSVSAPYPSVPVVEKDHPAHLPFYPQDGC